MESWRHGRHGSRVLSDQMGKDGHISGVATNELCMLEHETQEVWNA